MTHNPKKPNRLINEKSPYLLQHAFNPVDWFPWSDEAFETARSNDKPIFLSIGYSTCHWCHVMEKESFENENIAKLMDEVFISIKVDREERPDIDNIYMLVCQMITGSGGWPLSIIMTPEKKPFFAGTYFPPESRYGRIGFFDLIKNINAAWKDKRKEIDESVAQISLYLSQVQEQEQKVNLETGVLDSAFKQYENRYDLINGGFGVKPKFPSPHNLMFLLRDWKRTGASSALNMVTHTLSQMRRCGIFDQIGFGFHRYSTDERWLVPHFEKMLYDQAMLIIVYTEAYLATGNNEFKQTAEEICEYVIRDMTSSLGGFYSAEDADSEGQEGKFYLWTKRDFEESLELKDAEFAGTVFNIKVDGNFHDETAGQINGMNILHMSKSKTELAQYYGMTERDFQHKLEKIRSQLFTERMKRISPFKDDKILCDWNGLMIAALSIAGRTFSNSRFTLAAQNAASFVKSYLYENNGRLIHRFRDGLASLTANIDDYAFLTWGLLELYRATFNKSYLDEAERLTQHGLKYFWDDKAGGFYFSPDYAEQLLARTKEIYDGAIPSGNSVMLLNMIKLNRITANPDYINYAHQLIDAFSHSIAKTLTGSAFSLISLEYLFGESNEIIVVGKSMDDETTNIISEINKHFLPGSILIFINMSKGQGNLNYEYLRAYRCLNDKPTIYVCKNFACDLPTNNLDDAIHKLGVKAK